MITKYNETDQVRSGYKEQVPSAYVIFIRHVKLKGLFQCHQYWIHILNIGKYVTGKQVVDTSQLKVISESPQQWVANNVVTLIHRWSRKEKVLIAIVLSSDTRKWLISKELQKV